ncbi:MAG: hypothetical protein RLO51_13230 [Thalassobaculum sp.]
MAEGQRRDQAVRRPDHVGPPSGVGPVKRGDKLHGHAAGVGDLRLAVV